MRRYFVGLLGIGVTLVAACDPNDPLTEPGAASAGPPELAITAAQQVADEFSGPSEGLGADWYTPRPAYVLEAGQVSTVPGLSASTAAVWQTNTLPADHYSEVTVGDLAGGSFTDFRGLQVFVRLQTPTSSERMGFHYLSAERRYQIKVDGISPGQVLAATGPVAPPSAGDVLRLEAAGDVYVGRLNGREILRTRGPMLAGRWAGFAIGIDKQTRRNPRRVVDTWSAGALDPARARRPLTDLSPFTYVGFRGGLYPSGSNTVPARHDSVGRARARSVVPRDARGNPSPAGKYVLLSVGMSNTTQEWCAVDPGPCSAWTFTGQAMADPTVNRTGLAIANGAMGAQTAETWDEPTDLNYDRVRDRVLAPRRLTEQQVQIIWLKVANRLPAIRGSLPDTTSDADLLVAQMGNIVRAARIRYPNLQLVFVSSRIYAGYAVIPLNPEPYAYESGLAVKWLVGTQIAQMATGVPDGRAGDLNYETVAPWVGWGPYLWADGLNPRGDGLIWERADFQPDGTHPSVSGQRKVGTVLLNFFKTDARASCWFLAGGRC